MLLSEAYYGKDKILLECEKQISILMEEANNLASDKNSHPANKRLQELLAKKFNVEKVIITWIPEMIVNAYTHPITFMIDITKEDIKTVVDRKNGVKFKNPKGKVMTLSVYEGATHELTAGEILATILHEIGHNFFVLQHTFILSKIDFFLSLLQELIQDLQQNGIPLNTIIDLLQYSFYYSKPGRKVQVVSTDAITQNEKFREFHNMSKAINIIIKFMNSLVIDAVTLCILPVSILGIMTMSVIKIPIFFIRELISAGYSNEKFADNFATSYGYGPEIVSAMSKMDNHARMTNVYTKSLSDTPVGYIYNITYSIISFFAHLGDPHPMAMARVTDQLNMLEKELEKPLPKHQKDIIRKDIQKIRQVQERMQDVSEKVGFEFMNKFLQTCFGGDPREIFLKTKDYDKRDEMVLGWREDMDLEYFMDI